jgi:hypothetical protein
MYEEIQQTFDLTGKDMGNRKAAGGGRCSRVGSGRS